MHTQGRKASLFASKALTKSSHKQEALLKSKATSTHVRTHRSIAACVGSPEPGGCVAGCRVATGLSAAGRRLFWGEIPLASYAYFCQPACTGLERVTVPATLQASDSLGMRDWGASAVNLGRNTHVQQQYWSNQKTLQVDYTFICFCPSPVKINTHIPKGKVFVTWHAEIHLIYLLLNLSWSPPFTLVYLSQRWYFISHRQWLPETGHKNCLKWLA